MFKRKGILQMALDNGPGTQSAPWATALCRRCSETECTARKAWSRDSSWDRWHGRKHSQVECMLQKPFTGSACGTEEGWVETALTGKPLRKAVPLFP